ncbi:MAG: SufD family Fe-S cluster assembly protein, partial [Proteobacteria bacterium]|nr:SufD family Fe-S cluster assembly protein [Candidatus Fonsibacter sp. PEL5]
MNTITDIKEVNELRTLSLNLFNKHGYPTRKDEDWKQSQLNYFLENNKQLEIYKPNNETINEKVFENFKHNKIVIVNGLVQKTDFVGKDKDKLIITTIDEYYKKNNKHLSKLFSNKKNPLVAANNALAKAGFYLEIKDNLDLPIIIYHQYNSKIDQKQLHQKNYILINKNSKASVFEKFTNENKKTFISINTNIDVEQNSHIKNYIVNSNNTENCIYRFKKVNIAASANYESFIFSNIVKTIRDEVEINLNESLSECYLYYAQFLKNNEDHEIKVKINHLAENTQSYQFSKSIVDGTAKGVYQGKIFVDQIAQKTNGYQLIKSVLLSDQCTFHSKPELEIYADDVKCSHGSSSTSLNKDELFYL